MKIRNKILLYFSSTVLVLSATSLVIVFLLFAAHREEEFQQQQFSKIKHTIGLIEEFGKMSAEISQLLDQQYINDFYDEKLLIYDHNKNLIFSSIDSLGIEKATSILHRLSVSHQWIETKEEDYDLIGVYIENNTKAYYAISKAYDYFGYSKKNFLQKVLITIFVLTAVTVLLLSFYLSHIITKPLTELTKRIGEYNLDDDSYQPVAIHSNTRELQELSSKFNELLKRTTEAFNFQKNSIQHISHELKTPIAVLVSELERIGQLDDTEEIKTKLQGPIQKAKSLGNIINVLLQISKVQAGQDIPKSPLRMDDILFDCVAEANSLYPQFNFEVSFQDQNLEESTLTVMGNESLLKQALLNLVMNAVHYAEDNKAKITFSSKDGRLQISIVNAGKTLAEEEQTILFSQHFRGKNALHQQGFGMGLFLSQSILAFHGAAISYQAKEEENFFTVSFPSS